MTDINKLAEDYIKRQERFYGRDLRSFNKFLIKDFAKSLKGVADSLTLAAMGDQTALKGNIRVALITEEGGHLTGGRYYAYFIAVALMELGMDVLIYTNKEVTFSQSFRGYELPLVNVVADKAQELENIDVIADIYIGTPISGNIAASKLGKKYNKPSYAMIFDPFPMMAKYLGDKKYVGWTPLVKQLRESNTEIISLCDTTTPYIYDWLNKRPAQVHPIYPCINSRENKAIDVKKEDYVLFISRMVKHKNFDHVLRACKKLGYRLKVISSVDGIGGVKLVADMGMKKQVDFYMKCSDEEKFNLIAGARVVVNATMFEGFGMWAIEAIALGVPLVCYDYPTIHEIQKFSKAKNIYYAKWNQEGNLESELQKAYEEQKYAPPCHLFDFEAMVKRVNQVFSQEPRIGVITICLNEEQFIQASLRSVIKHPNVKKVAVVEGAVNLYAHAASDKGLSLDQTRDSVYQVKREGDGDKIIYERYGWALDKSELRNRALTLLGDNITHVLVVDADEVWKMEDLDNLVKAMRENPRTGVFLFPFYHFWKQKDLIATGGQWESKMFRCFKYNDKNLHWGMHQLPVVNKEGKFINVTDGSMDLDNVHVYHYSYLKKQQNILEKLEYYKKRDGEVLDVKDTWSNWKKGQETQPTHGGGTAVKFKGTHPKEVEGLI